jgi:hypothetical protein
MRFVNFTNVGMSNAVISRINSDSTRGYLDKDMPSTAGNTIVMSQAEMDEWHLEGSHHQGGVNMYKKQ